MTENTIDLAAIALNVSGSSDATSPDSIGIWRHGPPFTKALDDAMHNINLSGALVCNDTGQRLPVVRQKLPLDDTCGLGLDSLKEVRALADSITGKTVPVTDKSYESLMSGSALFAAPAPATASVSVTFVSPPGAEEYFVSDPKLQALRDSVAVATAPQQQTQPVMHIKEVQASEPLAANKSPNVVSTTDLATHLRVLKSSGGGEARLQLHPAELGRMTVTLTTEGNEARVAFVVDNTQARQAVEASLPRLRDLLDGAGVDLADTDVSERDSDKNKSQSGHQTPEDSGTSSSKGGDVFDESSVAAGTHLIDAFA